jgi:VIT1/CCC1 family predicted Fe2+/Mn2+ transporter
MKPYIRNNKTGETNKMKNFFTIFSVILGGLILIVSLFTVPTYWLWNWLMPTIFGLTKISLIQALGITILSAIIFGRAGSRDNYIISYYFWKSKY